MPRLFYVHWDRTEAGAVVNRLRAAGYTVAAHWNTEAAPRLSAKPPDAIVISLDRLPSHGRAVAEYFVQTRRYRDIPLLLVGGAPEKVSRARSQFPGARLCPAGRLLATLRAVVKPG